MPYGQNYTILRSVVDLDAVGSALFGWIRIRIVTEKTDPDSIKDSQTKFL